MKLPPRLCLVLVSCGLLSLATSASRLGAAEPPSAAPELAQETDEAEARRLVRHGLAAHARGDHLTALADYERASTLVPDANLPWLYRAETLRALGRLDEALSAYERYLAMDPTVSDADAVRAKVAEVRAQRRGRVVIETQPAGAHVRDRELGTALGTTPLTTTLARGPHRLEIRMPGYEPQQLDLAVEAGDSQRHALTLVAIAPAARPVRPCFARRVVGASTAGAGVVGLALGLVADLALAGTAKSDFEAARARGANDEAAAANDRYQTAGVGAGLGYLLGGTLLVAGATVALWPCPRPKAVGSSAPFTLRF